MVNYRGTLINGTEFDSSHKRNKPATFRVDRVIPGWTQALKMMKEGARWQIFVPAKLAYGKRGAGAGIPPGSALIFELELLSIVERPAPGAPEESPAANSPPAQAPGGNDGSK
jgi:FKBP-type peptidyl-prolyl cis-trans isomerase FklB